MQRQRVAHPNDSVAQDVNVAELEDVDDALEEFSVDDAGLIVSDSVRNSAEAEGPDETDGNADGPVTGHGTEVRLMEVDGPVEQTRPKKIRAQFGRKRTHNEQIMVAPCGMIIARATFFGAEAVSTVVVRRLLGIPCTHLKASIRSS